VATGTGIVTIPNLLSGLRLASVPVFLWLFASGREKAAVVLYGAGASTDWLDGYIARRTRSVTELGKLLDPLADRAFIVALALALRLRGALPAWLAGVIVLRDGLMVALFPIVDARTARRMRVNFVGKSATAALLVGLTGQALAQTTWPLAPAGGAVGRLFMRAGACLYWISGLMYAREAIQRMGDARRGSSLTTA
jgi:cardiolipin synthase (CMP-forming)